MTPPNFRRTVFRVAKQSGQVGSARRADRTSQRDVPATKLKSSALLDTRVIYCGDNLEQLAKLPDACNSAFRTPHFAFTVTGSFYDHCDWHASHYIKVMRIFGENNLTN